MIRHTPRERVIAVGLAGLAGYVDAIGFLQLGGYFVSFMTGNSTRMSVELAENLGLGLMPAALIALFVMGVITGSLAGHFSGQRRPMVVSALVFLLLLGAAASQHVGVVSLAIVAMALAMGAENAVFERDGEVTIGLTYMTGTLVKLGQRITAALLGGDRWAWVWYFMLWVGLVTGAILGAATYGWIGLSSLWAAAAAAGFLTAIIGFGMRGRAGL